MALSRNRLYTIILIACFAGYIWLYYNISTASIGHKSVEVCLIHNITNLPCPSCGSTRSVISLAKGDFINALHTNPIGFIIAGIMLLAPVWIVTDMITGGKTFFNFYQTIATALKKPKYAIPLIVLVISNWIWNIVKGL